MAYASLSDVNSYFANSSFDSSTAITQTQIDAWLDQDSKFIDGRIEKTIELTEITTAGLEILKQINAKLTVNRVDKALPYFNSRTKDEAKNNRNCRKEALDMIKMIESRDLRISDSFKTDIDCVLVNTGLENFGEPEFPKNILL